MDVVLCYTSSEPNTLEKNISTLATLEGRLKDRTSIVNPIIVIEVTEIIDCNYVHIPAFSRYYYVNDIVSVRNNLWELHLHCDVLQSFNNEIKHCTAIVNKATPETGTQYLHTQGFVSLVKKKTDIIQFPNGFNDNGNYILITTGGIAI